MLTLSTMHYFFLGLFRFYLLLVTSLFQELKSSEFSLDLKRIVVLFFLSTAIPFLIVWNYIGLLLDDYCFSHWSKVVIHEPTFIVGNARSGTTWVHRLLALDESMFTSVRTWELLFAVSVTWKKLFSAAYVADAIYACGLFYYLVRVIECYLLYGVSLASFRRSNYLHVVGLMEVEEDEWLMVYVGYAQLITLLFPLGIHTASLADVIGWNNVRPGDYQMAETKKMIFRFYRSCVQKHLLWKQQFLDQAALRANLPRPRVQLRYLSKNPAFTMRIPALYDEFPDSKVVCLLRDPCASVPSMVSYIAHVWGTFASPRFKYPAASTLLDFCIAHYTYPCEQLASPLRPENQWAFVYYSDLLVHRDPASGDCRCDLRDTVMRLLDRLYYSNSAVSGTSNVKNARLAEILDSEAAVAIAKGFRSVHEHSVEQCCDMTVDEFRARLAVVYQTHTRLDGRSVQSTADGTKTQAKPVQKITKSAMQPNAVPVPQPMPVTQTKPPVAVAPSPRMNPVAQESVVVPFSAPMPESVREPEPARESAPVVIEADSSVSPAQMDVVEKPMSPDSEPTLPPTEKVEADQEDEAKPTIQSEAPASVPVTESKGKGKKGKGKNK